MVDATIHLDEHPEADFEVDVKPNGLVAIRIKDPSGYRVTIWAKPDKALELAEMLEFSLLPTPLVNTCV